jgi:catechol 2,3-dioxygenase-like lactoylglutathione lyase family enzyme
MSGHRTVFNHVGICVSNRERSRRFYEKLLGFEFWWDIDLPDAATEKLLMLQTPIGVHATYLVRDGFVLELIDYSKRDVTRSQRVMDEVGLTHISLSVSDLAEVLGKVAQFGGTVVEEATTDRFAMIRDPDGQLIELLPDTWLAGLPPRPKLDPCNHYTRSDTVLT